MGARIGAGDPATSRSNVKKWPRWGYCCGTLSIWPIRCCCSLPTVVDRLRRGSSFPATTSDAQRYPSADCYRSNHRGVVRGCCHCLSLQLRHRDRCQPFLRHRDCVEGDSEVPLENEPATAVHCSADALDVPVLWREGRLWSCSC